MSSRLSDEELACAEAELTQKEGARYALKAECRRARAEEIVRHARAEKAEAMLAGAMEVDRIELAAAAALATAEADCAAMRKALIQLHDTAGCQNGCEPTDMTCATNVAVAALATDSGKRLLEERERRARLLREAMAAVDRTAPDLAGRIEKELEP